MSDDGEGSYLNALLLLSKGDAGGAVDLFADFLSRCPENDLERCGRMVNGRIAEYLQTDFDLRSIDSANYGRLSVVLSVRGSPFPLCADLFEQCREKLSGSEDGLRIFHTSMGLVKLSQMSLAAAVMPVEFINILDAMERYYSAAEFGLMDLGEDVDAPGDAIRAMRSFAEKFGTGMKERCSALDKDSLDAIREKAYTPPKPPFFDALVDIFVHMDCGIGNCETGYSVFEKERDRLIDVFFEKYLRA